MPFARRCGPGRSRAFSFSKSAVGSAGSTERADHLSCKALHFQVCRRALRFLSYALAQEPRRLWRTSPGTSSGLRRGNAASISSFVTRPANGSSQKRRNAGLSIVLPRNPVGFASSDTMQNEPDSRRATRPCSRVLSSRNDALLRVRRKPCGERGSVRR